MNPLRSLYMALPNFKHGSPRKRDAKAQLAASAFWHLI
jgi:hypothetical protein